MGGCQNYGPFLDPHYNTAPNILGTPKGIIILTTTHMIYYEDQIGMIAGSHSPLPLMDESVKG